LSTAYPRWRKQFLDATTNNAIGSAHSRPESSRFGRDFTGRYLLGNMLAISEIFLILNHVNIVGIDDWLGCACR